MMGTPNINGGNIKLYDNLCDLVKDILNVSRIYCVRSLVIQNSTSMILKQTI